MYKLFILTFILFNFNIAMAGGSDGSPGIVQHFGVSFSSLLEESSPWVEVESSQRSPISVKFEYFDGDNLVFSVKTNNEIIRISAPEHKIPQSLLSAVERSFDILSTEN